MDLAPQLTPAQAGAALEEGALAVDVREPEEWQAGHVDGSLWIPLGELQSRAGELPRDRPLVIVCRSGARSGYAADALVAAGYDASNLAGGLHAWAAAALPLVPSGGYVL
ncbi:MAG TPA: rhodanese-like domain-containing protein [Gaiellales bacterium]|nr:rhodanese-like domain-containing protein [Gaiellales bacterium]